MPRERGIAYTPGRPIHREHAGVGSGVMAGLVGGLMTLPALREQNKRPLPDFRSLTNNSK